MNEQYSKIYCITRDLEVAKITLASSKLAKEIGFTSNQQNLIATIVSELGRNILNHAGKGEIRLGLIVKGSTKGIEIAANDQGPGIKDIKMAMQDNYSTKKTLGLGLPAVKRMADELEIETQPGKGTSITARKWLRNGKS